MIFVSNKLQILQDDYNCDNDNHMEQTGTTDNRAWQFWGERWHNGVTYRRLDIEWYCYLRLNYENYVRQSQAELLRLIAEGQEKKRAGFASDTELEILRTRVKRLQEVATLSKRQFDIVQAETSFLGDSRAINAEMARMSQMIKTKSRYYPPVSGQIALDRLRERLEDNRDRLRQVDYMLPLALCLPVAWGLSQDRIDRLRDKYNRYLGHIARVALWGEGEGREIETIANQTTVAQNATLADKTTIDFNSTLVCKLPLASETTIAQRTTVERHATKSNNIWYDCACHQGLIIESKNKPGEGEPLLRTRAEVEMVVEMLISGKLRLDKIGLRDYS